MTWKVGCMPEQGIDLTSLQRLSSDFSRFRWPNCSGIHLTQRFLYTVQEHEVRVVVSENFGIDSSSAELQVTESVQSDTITSGTVPLELAGDEKRLDLD